MSTLIILDFRAIDGAQRRRNWRLAFIALIISAAFTAALVGTLFHTDGTRIVNAMFGAEQVI